jgi:hypothetical protein
MFEGLKLKFKGFADIGISFSNLSLTINSIFFYNIKSLINRKIPEKKQQKLTISPILVIND